MNPMDGVSVPYEGDGVYGESDDYDGPENAALDDGRYGKGGQDVARYNRDKHGAYGPESAYASGFSDNGPPSANLDNLRHSRNVWRAEAQRLRVAVETLRGFLLAVHEEHQRDTIGCMCVLCENAGAISDTGRAL